MPSTQLYYIYSLKSFVVEIKLSVVYLCDDEYQATRPAASPHLEADKLEQHKANVHRLNSIIYRASTSYQRTTAAEGRNTTFTQRTST
ncbi:hypothetical protein E4U42_005693 [Claviceps africana]|uniref:Uncharacterized protein n=1 Tax=Claviceps africana TaxID=83212 RepID=A0A8K0J3X8_9HYPO|nr:hypothetical protein E4U42_005693 [Claviceps africana]